MRDGVGPRHEAPGLEHGHADRRVVHLAVNVNTGYGIITPDMVLPAQVADVGLPGEHREPPVSPRRPVPLRRLR